MEIEKDRPFGEWTVICEAPRMHSAPRMWLCRCSCGRVVPVRGARLLAGKTSKCRQCALDRMRESRVKSYKGRRLGTRKVIGPGDRPGTWRTRCKCGREDEIGVREVVRSRVRRCRSCAISEGLKAYHARRRAADGVCPRPVSRLAVPAYVPTPEEIRAACLAIRRELGHDLEPDLT